MSNRCFLTYLSIVLIQNSIEKESHCAETQTTLSILYWYFLSGEGDSRWGTHFEKTLIKRSVLLVLLYWHLIRSQYCEQNDLANRWTDCLSDTESPGTGKREECYLLARCHLDTVFALECKCSSRFLWAHI